MRESVPVDVKLLNLVTSVLITVLVLSGLAALVWWGVHHSAFSIRGITVVGDVKHNNASTLRDSVVPQLTGNFFTLNLDATRRRFEEVPWVRQALIQREFPNRVKVTLEEHVPLAYWGKAPNQLVNKQGEVFEASTEGSDLGSLPRLLGPAGHSALMLESLQMLTPRVRKMGLELLELELLSRGGWRILLNNEAVLMLGRGTPGELAARIDLLASTAPEIAARQNRTVKDIVLADMRHSGAYALKLRGVTTVPETPAHRAVNRRN